MAKKQAKSIPETQLPKLGVVKSGTKVKHAIFGKGVIVDIALWDNGEVTIGVQFEEHGLKWLVPEYAGLEARLS